MFREGHRREYPNVKARLRLSRKGPGLPERESYMDIWMKDTRFRVRDESGRDLASILADLSATNGLGSSPHSIEEIMDIWSQSRDEGMLGPTELYGDMATNEGWVRRGKEDAWSISAEDIAPAAEQILVDQVATHLQPAGEITCLGRSCNKYSGFLEGEVQGTPFKSAVTQIIFEPYLLSSIVRDSKNADHYYSREIIALEEGAATDKEVTPSPH